ncbi:MAG: MarR family transcriptional regulator [Parvularculaceae bacterium]
MSDRLDLALVSLRQILRATELSSRALAKQCGLTPSQLIMMQIIRNWNGASPGYLAKEISLTQATITALIDKLEERGLAYRERDEDDKRRIFVKLTEDGLRILDEAPDSLQQRFEAGFSKLEDWEQSMVVAALERIVALLEAKGIDAAPVLDVGAIGTLTD